METFCIGTVTNLRKQTLRGILILLMLIIGDSANGQVGPLVNVINDVGPVLAGFL